MEPCAFSIIWISTFVPLAVPEVELDVLNLDLIPEDILLKHDVSPIPALHHQVHSILYRNYLFRGRQSLSIPLQSTAYKPGSIYLPS